MEREGSAQEDNESMASCATTGLGKEYISSGKGKVRPAAKKMPVRSGPIWKTVRVKSNDKAFTTAPELVCLDCQKSFSGGVSRVKGHIMKQCTCSTQALKELKQSLLLEAAKENLVKDQKRRENEVDLTSSDWRLEHDEEDAETVSPSDSSRKGVQQAVDKMFNAVSNEIMDEKIANLIYGEGLPFTFVESPQFLDLLHAAKFAAPSYKPPSQVRMSGGPAAHHPTQCHHSAGLFCCR